ncbi:hypothetical protein JW968_07500 [Candidatus Woesearchaeota archaeon]|nr:hypothetical protein [Candidatus Woesearchaeota archaeon]
MKYNLEIGKKLKIRIGFLKYLPVMYCGYVNEHTFSIGHFHASGHQGYAINLYYPKKANTIQIGDNHFRVGDITTERIELETIKN